MERIRARCPELSLADVAELKKRVPVPEGDIDKAKNRAWHDAQDLQLRRTAAAGQRIADMYRRCRGDEQRAS